MPANRARPEMFPGRSMPPGTGFLFRRTENVPTALAHRIVACEGRSARLRKPGFSPLLPCPAAGLFFALPRSGTDIRGNYRPVNHASRTSVDKGSRCAIWQGPRPIIAAGSPGRPPAPPTGAPVSLQQASQANRFLPVRPACGRSRLPRPACRLLPHHCADAKRRGREPRLVFFRKCPRQAASLAASFATKLPW
jgi:hypothetical protein